MAASFPAKEGYAPVPGGKVWYMIVGSGDAVPLLTVHGGPGATHDYLESLADLADERPVIFYDQLGSGKSDKPEDISLWHNDRFVAELGQLIDALAITQVHLLGQSWGTILATEYALRQPARIASLILASPCLSVPRYIAGAAALRAELPADVRAVLDRHEAAGTTDSEEYDTAVREFYRRHLCRINPLPDPVMRTFTRLNQTVYNTMWGPNEFTATGIHKDYDVTHRLADVAAPTLFTCGRYDEVRPEETARCHSLLLGSELVIFDQSSHMAHLEEAEAYLQIVRDFLHRVEAPSSGRHANGDAAAATVDLIT